MVCPYDRLGQAHDAIHAWAAANHRAFAGQIMDDLRRLER